MDAKREDEKWIQAELVPSLVTNGKLSFGPFSQPAILRSVKAVRLPADESFMLTACYNVSVELAESSDETAEISVTKLVVKITPDVEKEWYTLCNFAKLFHNERIAYEQIFPKLGWTELFPKYYYSHIGDTKSVFVLGDFGVDGWRMCKQKINLSLEHILLSLAELGKFHGALYALKYTDRPMFDHLKNRLIESRFCQDFTQEQWARVLRLGPKRAANAVRSHPDTNQIIPESYLQRMETLMDDTYFYQKTKVAFKEPLAILIHGDFLRNNLAFRYNKDKPDVPVAAMMFDFQTLRYASPMVDFATFIANSTGVDVRSQHFNLMFDTYYDSLISNFCKGADLNKDNVPDFLSHDNLLREYAEYAPFGISIASSFLMITQVAEQFTFEELIEKSLVTDDMSSLESDVEIVDRELRTLMLEMYELQQKYDVELK